MDVVYLFAAAIIVLVFILLYKALFVFYGLSSSSGRSSVVLGFHVQLNCERFGDPWPSWDPLTNACSMRVLLCENRTPIFRYIAWDVGRLFVITPCQSSYFYYLTFHFMCIWSKNLITKRLNIDIYNFELFFYWIFLESTNLISTYYYLNSWSLQKWIVRLINFLLSLFIVYFNVWYDEYLPSLVTWSGWVQNFWFCS